MVHILEIIYYHLHHGSSRNNSLYGIESGDALRFLTEKQKLYPGSGLFQKLIIEIIKLREKYLPPGFIERFCLAQITEYILLKYPINIAEAYLLSYVAITKPVDLSLMYFKLGTSGLIGPTNINGTLITDVEAIAKFIIKSLTDAELIKVTENKYIIFGKNFSIDL